MSEQIKQNWFLLGDIHGSAEPIRYFYNQNRERLSLDECDNYIILLGDVGCNFALTGQRDYKFKMELSQLPFTYICWLRLEIIRLSNKRAYLILIFG